MIITASVGASVLAYYGFADVLIFAYVGVFTLIASLMGARLSAKTMPWVLRLVYAALIILVGGYVAIDGLTRVLL